MKIYTKRGDSGSTDLYDGSRIEKTDEIFNALGSLDELSSQIGMLITYLRQNFNTHAAEFLRGIQQDLLNIGSIIATPNPKADQILPEITEEHVRKLELYIDIMDATLEPLTVFIKVGGINLIESQTHICRTVCRRGERDVLKCGFSHETVNKYLNRLSDFFFTFARANSNIISLSTASPVARA